MGFSGFFAFFKRKLRQDKFISWEKNVNTHILNPFPVNREIHIEKFRLLSKSDRPNIKHAEAEQRCAQSD